MFNASNRLQQRGQQAFGRVLLGFQRGFQSQGADGFAGFRADGRQFRLRKFFSNFADQNARENVPPSSAREGDHPRPFK